MQLKRRKLAVRLTPESIPFRDGVIRMALVPFPRKRKDGTYKPDQEFHTDDEFPTQANL